MLGCRGGRWAVPLWAAVRLHHCLTSFPSVLCALALGGPRSGRPVPRTLAATLLPAPCAPHPLHRSKSRQASAQAPTTEKGTVQFNVADKLADDQLAVALQTSLSTTTPVYFADVASTPMLDKDQFIEVIVRLAQFLYHKQKTLPTVTSRLEKLLREMETSYPKLFGGPMKSDLHVTERGIPVLEEVVPDRVVCTGDFEVQLKGRNFCNIRGVYVQFSSGTESVVVKTRKIEEGCVTVQGARMRPSCVRAEIVHDGGVFRVEVFRVSRQVLAASNDRLHYTENNPPITLVFEDPFPQFTLPDDLAIKLSRLFSTVDRNTTGKMNEETWLRFRAEHRLGTPAKDVQGGGDSYFTEVATSPQGDDAKKCVNFQGFLKIIIRIYAELPNADTQHIVQCLRQLVQVGKDKQGLDEQNANEEDELKQARALIKLIQRGTIRTLDIYCGPVICGTIQERPGQIIGFKADQKDKHKFLTYQQHDINTETRIRNHISMAESFDHLLNRLLLDGFELASSCDPKTRKPTGRCWTIHHGKEKIGALWDYEGQMSNLEWQPAQVESTNDNMTMTVYRSEDDIHYTMCYMCFIKTKDVSQLRTLLNAKGYSLQTLLYKL